MLKAIFGNNILPLLEIWEKFKLYSLELKSSFKICGKKSWSLGMLTPKFNVIDVYVP